MNRRELLRRLIVVPLALSLVKITPAQPQPTIKMVLWLKAEFSYFSGNLSAIGGFKG